MATQHPTAILADDEAAPLADLRRGLHELWPELKVVGEAAHGAQALELIEALQPDIAFLDSKMPGMSGVEVARRLSGGAPRIIFVTAFDQYAVEAFERGAIDYLLKPVARDRLAQTVARLRQPVGNRPDLTALQTLLTQFTPFAQRLSWIRAGSGETVRLIHIDEIVYFQSKDKYTTVRTTQGEALIRTPLNELEGQLDPDRFWRIHRGALVNVTFIDRVQRGFSGKLSLKLRDLSETLEVSRAHAHLFRQM